MHVITRHIFILPSNSGPTTITHWKRQWPGLNVAGCMRSGGPGAKVFAGPGGTLTTSALWLNL